MGLGLLDIRYHNYMTDFELIMSLGQIKAELPMLCLSLIIHVTIKWNKYPKFNAFQHQIPNILAFHAFQHSSPIVL